VQPHDRGVRVVTTDESHEVLGYTRGRRIRLAPDPPRGAVCRPDP
jgi:hypothetical protein